MRSNEKRNGSLRGRGFTFVELIVALVIVAILSVAISTMTFGAMSADRFSRSVNTAQSEIELSIRRIANNIREAQTGSIALSQNSLATLTQEDPFDNCPTGAAVTYTLATDPTNSSQQVLMETDPRYGSNILAHNVTKFVVTAVTSVTGLYQVDLVLAGPMIEERHIQVFTRN